jgi:predicted nucleic acid-binding protein
MVMRLFMDASALLKNYVLEPGTSRVQTLLHGADELVVSVLALPETVSALNRLLRQGHIDGADYGTAKAMILKDVHRSTTVPLVDAVIGAAIVVLERSVLRASDAIHIASAEEAGVDLFASADRRQCDAAEAMGVPVERIAL